MKNFLINTNTQELIDLRPIASNSIKRAFFILNLDTKESQDKLNEYIHKPGTIIINNCSKEVIINGYVFKFDRKL